MAGRQNMIDKFFIAVVTVAIIVFVFRPGRIMSAGSVADVGMITRLEGEVVFLDDDNKDTGRKVQVFMKIRQDDVFRLSPDAVLQMVYFENGQKKTLRGPGIVRVIDSSGQTTGKIAEKNNSGMDYLPDPVVKEIKRMVPLVDPSRLLRTGSFHIRGKNQEDDGNDSLRPQAMELDTNEKDAIVAAEKIFTSLQKKSDPNDIYSELYFFSVLADYDQFDRMEDLVRTMRKKQPDNRGIDLLEKWLAKQH